ncbi:saccharopine dehydrogenase NADP-binding domain-containing protein [Streptomyces hydrogenans]|uniref:saccharopine dehydrogenase NADP-binding domain-containing protein n=1 Tax=Streptomyces hydrogenans TaxID=1873719 RepID=UPI0035DAD5B3
MVEQKRGVATRSGPVGADAPRRVVFIGASDAPSRSAVERFVRGAGDCAVTLCDARPERVEAWARSLPGGRVSVQRLDPGDPGDLLAAIKAAALVVLGPAARARCAATVRTACIEAGVPCLDFYEDVARAASALAFARAAEEAGVPLFVGCGASLGLSSMLAVDAARELDSVRSVDTLWTSGEHARADRKVLEGLLNTAGGGSSRHDPASVPAEAAEFTPDEVGERYARRGSERPEAVAFSRRLPVGARVHAAGKPGLGLLARVAGTYDGEPAVVIRRTPADAEGAIPLNDAAVLAGTACAAFALLALDRAANWKGVLAPEDWADPEAFYTAVERTGVHPADIVETVV